MGGGDIPPTPPKKIIIIIMQGKISGGEGNSCTQEGKVNKNKTKTCRGISREKRNHFSNGPSSEVTYAEHVLKPETQAAGCHKSCVVSW